jgi:dienelactone hydrolase
LPISTGQAKGKVIKVGGDFEAYEAVPSGDYDKTKVLLLLTDVFGIELNNNKLLADGFADNGIRTLIPEYLQKDPIPKDAMSGGNFDLMAWLGKHGAETVNPALHAAVDHVKSEGVKSIGGGPNSVAFVSLKGSDKVFTYSYRLLLWWSICLQSSI